MKLTKQEVNYRQGDDYTRCQLCRMFKQPHSCTAVTGIIQPGDVCDIFEQARSPFTYEPDKGGEKKK